MFVHYYTHVPLPAQGVEERIAALASHMLDWAGVAYREGEELRARVGPAGDGPAKEVVMELGPPQRTAGGVTYHVTWRATGAAALFPRLTADLSIAPIGEELTHLGFQGTYDPPFGGLGRAIDRVALGRVADATIKAWVDRLAQALVSEVTVE